MYKKIKMLTAMIFCIIIISAAVIAAQKGMKLFMNGKVASSDVRIIDGRAYVPLKDVASAFNMVITEKSEGYELSVPGGTYQVEGVKQGKIGDELFTGKWKFQVLSFEQIEGEYKEKYYQAGRTIKPQGANDVLLLVHCRIKNGLKKTQTPVLTERIPGNTALADDNSQSYAPVDYDARQESDKTQSYAAASLVPGAGMDFTLIFSVPKGTKAKALIFSLLTYPNDVGKKETVDVRINFSE
jgi:hypothetical protein